MDAEGEMMYIKLYQGSSRDRRGRGAVLSGLSVQ